MFKLLIIIVLPVFSLAQLPALPSLQPLLPLPTLSSSNQPQTETQSTLHITLELAENEVPINLLFDDYYHHNNNDTLSLNQFLWLFLEGIAQGVETGGHYNPYYATNPYSSARGRWQMTDAFWQTYSYLYCDSMGLPRHILSHTPRNQRLIAYWAARDMFWRHYRPQRSPLQIISLMAKEWYGGRKALNDNWDIVPSPWQNKLTFRQYAWRVINKIFKLNQGKKIILNIKQTRRTKS